MNQCYAGTYLRPGLGFPTQVGADCDRYRQGTKVTGVLYLREIKRYPIEGPEQKTLDMLKALCGPEAFRNVIFVWTNWDKFRKGDFEDRNPWRNVMTTPTGMAGSRFTTTRESLLKDLEDGAGAA
jgi:hypothetical protein